MYTTARKKIVSTEKAPKAIGPYSQAVRTENLVFTAGQVGLEVLDGESFQPQLTVQIQLDRDIVTDCCILDVGLGNAPEFLNNGIDQRPEFCQGFSVHLTNRFT